MNKGMDKGMDQVKKEIRRQELNGDLIKVKFGNKIESLQIRKKSDKFLLTDCIQVSILNMSMTNNASVNKPIIELCV